MTIYLGADHGGFQLKEQLKAWLQDWGYAFQDLGAFSLEPDDDYPDFVFPVAEQVAAGAAQGDMGILLCRSSGGMTLAANKVPGIRAVSLTSTEEAELARSKNHANIATLAGDYLTPDQARQIIKVFLETPPSDAQRHIRRLQKITKYEEKTHAVS